MTREDVFAYVLKKYATVPEYPWHEYPEYAVLRHTDDAKWYGLIMDVSCDKLGMEGTDPVDVLDLKVHPEEREQLLKMAGALPAYHMNKEHWISLVLAQVEKERVFKLVDESYALTEPRTEAAHVWKERVGEEPATAK